MIPLDRAIVARLESHGERFEVLVDPDLAIDIKQGKEVDLEDAVAALHIFDNAAHGSRAADESLMKVFHTIEFPVIVQKDNRERGDAPHNRAAPETDRR